jgi:glycosyltransferase involved in cell wall biosynthesis
MRIAVVTTSYPALPGDGAGHFVRGEALELARMGHEVHVIAPGSHGNSDWGDRAALQVWRVPHGGAFGWPGAISRMNSQPWRAAGALAFMTLCRARLRSLNADQIVAHWLVPSAWPIAVLAGGRASIEAVAHGADVRALVALPAIVRERIMATLLRRELRIRFVAHALRDSLGSLLSLRLRNLMMDRSTVCPVTLRVPDVSARADALRQQCSKPILATAVGRLITSKRMDLAIGAANLLGNDAQLQVVGDGPDFRRLRSLDRVGNVKFLGQVRRDEALAWIAAADVLIHPSAVEAAPTVVREARALGTRVVACGSGDVQRWACVDPGITVVDATAVGIAGGVSLAAFGS